MVPFGVTTAHDRIYEGRTGSVGRVEEELAENIAEAFGRGGGRGGTNVLRTF